MNWNPFYRYPRIGLGVFLAALMPAIFLLRGFDVDTQVEVLLAGDQRNFESYQKIKEVISTNIPVFISMRVRDIYTPEGIQAIHHVSEAFEDMDGFLDAKSLTHSYKPVRSGMSFKMVPLASTNAVDPESLSKLRSYCRDNPLIRNVITSPDDQHNLIWLTFQKSFDSNPLARHRELKDFHQALKSRLEPFRSDEIDFNLIGVPTVESEVYQTLVSDAKEFALWTTAILLVMFWWVFRSLAATTMVIFNVVVGLLLTPAIFILLDFDLTVFTVILLPLLVVIQITLLTHLYLAYFQTASVDSDGTCPVGDASGRIWKSSAFAALTTIVSFSSLTLSDVSQVALFGKLGAVGMVLIFFICFGPGLSLLKIASDRNLIRQSRQIPMGSSSRHFMKPATACIRFALNHPLAILIVSGAACSLVIIGLGKVRSDIRIEEFLAPESETRAMMSEMDEAYGGMNILQLFVDTGADYGITRIDNLKFLESLADQSVQMDGVTGVYSFSQVIAMMNQIWEKEKPGSLKIPSSSFLVNIFVSALQAQDYPFLTTLCDKELRTGSLIVRTRNMPSDKYLALVSRLEELAKSKAPEGVTISAKAAIKSLMEADRRVFRSQTDTAATTVLIVFLLLTLLWKSPAAGMTAMVANVLPVAAVIALTGWFEIPLNSITVMVAAIAFGIAVDDSVHFMTYFREKVGRLTTITRADFESSLLETIETKGKPIFYTSVMLILVFLLLGLSSFPPVQHFGILGATAFALALLSLFLLVPALLALWFRPGKASGHPGD